MTLRICVYGIAYNEEKFVERFCESAKKADLILIGDTGSSDGTVELIEGICVYQYAGREVRVEHIRIKPWRFDLARNAVLAMIPEDIDVCVSLDLDEVLQPGWRQEIERVWETGKTTRLGYMFDWGLGIAFRYEKIHGRWGYRWHHPCHEYPMPYGIDEVWAETDKLLVVHKPDSAKSRAGYLPLLAMSVEEDPSDPRNAFYYARELSFNRQWQASIEACDRYLSLPRATWPNERCYAYRVKARCYKELGSWAEAERAYYQASVEAPYTREPWCELAHVMYLQGRWPECYAYAMRTLAIKNKEKVYTVDPDVWGAKPYLYACLGAWNIGLRKEALVHGQEALMLEPENELFRNNLKAMTEIMTAAGGSDARL